MVMIKVVCAIIYKENKVLICRRKMNKSLGGYWEFPGGKIEEDENPKDSLARELLEELDMEVEIMEYFMTNMHNYDRFSIELIAYKCIFKKSSFTLVDHDVYKWVDVKSLDKIKMAPADIPIAKKLVFF